MGVIIKKELNEEGSKALGQVTIFVIQLTKIDKNNGK